MEEEQTPGRGLLIDWLTDLMTKARYGHRIGWGSVPESRWSLRRTAEEYDLLMATTIRDLLVSLTEPYEIDNIMLERPSIDELHRQLAAETRYLAEEAFRVGKQEGFRLGRLSLKSDKSE